MWHAMEFQDHLSAPRGLGALAEWPQEFQKNVADELYTTIMKEPFQFRFPEKLRRLQ